MKKSYRYSYFVIPLGEGDEEAYQAVIPKFDNLHVFADTMDELHEQVMDAIYHEIKDRKRDGDPVPPEDKKGKFSGKILLRVDPKLHEKLYINAAANKMSLNKYLEQSLLKG